MGFRKTPFVNGEFYHIYNRGVDKRNIFNDRYDIERFSKGMLEFNSIEPIGSIYENSFLQEENTEQYPLVNFIAYRLNPNHYHFLIEQAADKGIEKIMQRIGTGYTKYFNNKYKRNGVLFQGVFKSIHIDSNEYLLHMSAYVNLNDQIHQLGSEASKLVADCSSWKEYIEPANKGICKKEVVLDQFKDKSEYREFALSSLKDIIERRTELMDIEKLLLE